MIVVSPHAAFVEQVDFVPSVFQAPAPATGVLGLPWAGRCG